MSGGESYLHISVTASAIPHRQVRRSHRAALHHAPRRPRAQRMRFLWPCGRSKKMTENHVARRRWSLSSSRNHCRQNGLRTIKDRRNRRRESSGEAEAWVSKKVVHPSDIDNEHTALTSGLIHRANVSQMHEKYDTSKAAELGRGACGSVVAVRPEGHERYVRDEDGHARVDGLREL